MKHQGHATAILRFADVPTRHVELTRELGPPDICFAAGDLKNDMTEERWDSSLWALESPTSAHKEIGEQLAWAAEIVASNEAFISSFIRSGVSVSLHLACHSKADFTLFTLDPQMLKPIIMIGVPIEIYTDTRGG